MASEEDNTRRDFGGRIGKAKKWKGLEGRYRGCESVLREGCVYGGLSVGFSMRKTVSMIYKWI